MVEQELRLHHIGSGVVKLMIGFHYWNLKVVELEIGLYYGCLGSDQEVFWGGKAKNGASPRESEGGGIHNRASHRESQGG